MIDLYSLNAQREVAEYQERAKAVLRGNLDHLISASSKVRDLFWAGQNTTVEEDRFYDAVVEMSNLLAKLGRPAT